MNDPQQALDWLEAQQNAMLELLCDWAAINSASDHLPGLAEQAVALERAFAPLGKLERVELEPRRWIDDAGRSVEQPLGELLHLRHAGADPQGVRVLLNIHYDTVHPPDGPFQQAHRVDANTLNGPGVVDAKGGIVVMLYALLALREAGLLDRLNYELILNPDEEIGSPGSSAFLRERARACDVGLVFEPTLPDGSMVLERGGSGNFTLVVRGRAAHAGRDFESGRNAVTALAWAIGQIDGLNQRLTGVTVNVARCVGGGPLNMVPELAVCRVNVRYGRREQEAAIRGELDQIVEALNAREGIAAELSGDFYGPPKPADDRLRALAGRIDGCAAELGLRLQWARTGGVSDGNRLAAAGLATVDTMGPRGGKLHSPEEYVLIDSLVERARLGALVLARIAAGG